MLTKLALAGVKNRRRDYLVLLAGLTMSAAIFYMFANLATNQAFIKANAVVKSASMVFGFGAVLLALITVVYIMYANSFLLSMRQHDYGLFMMLGAKRRRVGQLVFLETLILGTVATAIGIGLGILASRFLVGFLLDQLGLHLAHLVSFYGPAVLFTAVLYVGLFILASLFNLMRLMRTTVRQLLHADQQANQPKVRPVWQLIGGISGGGLLAVGYWAMAAITQLEMAAIPVALVTITLGTYLLFHATVLGIIRGVRRTKWAKRRLNGFLLGQLNFRIHDYTRMLTIVSLLFAMALGAITVGSGYHRQMPMMADSLGPYTVAVHNPTSHQKRLMARLHVAHQATYTQKVQGKTTYYNAAELKARPFQLIKPAQENLNGKPQFYTESLARFKKQGVTQLDFMLLSPDKAGNFAAPKIVSAAAFNRLKGQTYHVTTVRVHHLATDRAVLKQLDRSEQRRFPQKAESLTIGTYQAFIMMNGIFGGLEFIGYFLGIAFLAMLASCLMFKILSGAPGDLRRYAMLNKLGVRRGLMRQSLAKEIGILFAIPGIMGVIDVLFGLQMFKPLMSAPMSPYLGIGTTFVIFIGLYVIYYVITLGLYLNLVMPREVDRD